MERNYWLHRISGGNNGEKLSHNLLEKEHLLSIGWSDFSSDKFVQAVFNNGMKTIERKYDEEGWSLSRNRWNLYRFMVGMKKGDYVLVPTWKDFSVYEIVDDAVLSNESLDNDMLMRYGIVKSGHYLSDASECIDLGFYRNVVPVKVHIPRGRYAKQGLTSRMKIRQTNAQINDLESEILEALSAFERNTPICLKDELIKSSVDSILKQIRLNLDADKFEKLVEWYLESLGAKVIKTPAKNLSATEEGDADKIAYFDKLKIVVYVQTKKHNGTTNDWAVKQISNFYDNNNPERFDNDEEDFYTPLLWVISTCDEFSEAAKKQANKNNVRLINGRQFAQLVLENGIESLPL